MSDLVTLEGLHALKHAVRFGAEVTEIVTDDLDRVLGMADQVAPDLRLLLERRANVISSTRFRELTRQPVHTHLLAYATRPVWTLNQALPTPERPTILLDDPRNSKNLGAVVRVGAAAGAAGLLVNGEVDVCDPMAVRGAAGLQWALPWWASPDLLAELDEVRMEGQPSYPPTIETIQCGVVPDDGAKPRTESIGREGLSHRDTAIPYCLIGLDADGDPLDPNIAEPVIFAFGSERTGLSEAVRTRCDAICSLPMAPHVSSLNLATAVSAVLYVTRYARTAHP